MRMKLAQRKVEPRNAKWVERRRQGILDPVMSKAILLLDFSGPRSMKSFFFAQQSELSFYHLQSRILKEVALKLTRQIA